MEEELGYNQDNTNDTHVVKMDEQRPLNDTSCRHTTLIEDPSDKLGEATMHMCANPKCGIGFYIKK